MTYRVRHGGRRAATRKCVLGAQAAAALAVGRLCAGAASGVQADADEGRAAQSCARRLPPARRFRRPMQALWQIWGVNLRNLYGITEHTLVLCQSEPFQEPGDAGVPLYPKEVGSAPTAKSWCAAPACSPATGGTRKRPGRRSRTAGCIPAMSPRKWPTAISASSTARRTSWSPAAARISRRAKSRTCSRQLLYQRGGAVCRRPQISERVDRDRFRHGVRLGAPARHRLHRVHVARAASPRHRVDRRAKSKSRTTQLARVEQVKKFRIIPKELDPEEGDTTPTRKVKRRHIYAMFKDLVEDMYRDDQEVRD